MGDTDRELLDDAMLYIDHMPSGVRRQVLRAREWVLRGKPLTDRLRSVLAVTAIRSEEAFEQSLRSRK